MSEAHVSAALLGPAGETLLAWGAEREYYAASTVKLAVAAALLLAVEAGTLTLEQAVPSRRRFASRIPGAPGIDFAAEPDEVDPGMPADGTPVALGWCLERMITVSSNEATNLIVCALGGGLGAESSDPVAPSDAEDREAGVRGLDSVREACERLGVPGVRVERLICDYAARDAGFTHAASTVELARLIRAVACGDALRPASRDRLLRLLRAQRFPIIATALPEGAVRGSKSGWDEGIRHDVALLGEPGAPDCLALAICTEGFGPRGAQQAIRVLTAAILGAE